jgi:Helix-turn-helix domain
LWGIAQPLSQNIDINLNRVIGNIPTHNFSVFHSQYHSFNGCSFSSGGLHPHKFFSVFPVQAYGKEGATIALDCGFASQSHLNRHFHKLAGVTPKKYRDR